MWHNTFQTARTLPAGLVRPMSCNASVRAYYKAAGNLNRNKGRSFLATGRAAVASPYNTQFIKDVKGNECELLMRKYSFMVHRLYDYIKKLTMQETSSRTGAEYSTDFPNTLLPMPSKAAQEGEGFHPLSSGMVGPNEYKSYMGVQYNHMANNSYAYTQPCLNTPAMLNVRQPPYGNVLPVPSSVMPQCQPYLCGPTPTLMQDGAPVQAVMQHPQCAPMHGMMPRYSPLFGCSYEEKYYTPALMNTHVAGPWNAHPGDMNNHVHYPTGYTPIIDCLGGVPRIQ
ncbi:hypothetical protein BBBOND_0402970 [Babesia bigemina]|uniref:Uncharacterized protein n=1 Tax=Babesia bigemina TaxID=5866 RepID=A0A061DDZ4_BABBI|nr:hypothetical protein BBBOND_0402970 [Babesia bigemina]CDR97809.1 hypothetical protein BBBOND_0402970 [Babesia bigemina]|eukprot:XP_012769995.1 hypothetical protein BBBOND_0402970 [Babesia bigemina]